MEPAHLRFGGGVAETQLSPLTAIVLLIGIALLLALPRRKAIGAFLVLYFSIPIDQVVVLGGVHFTALRILIIAGLVRLIISKSSSGGIFPGRFNGIDLVVVLWTISGLIAISLQWMDSQALIKSLGDFLDALGGYLVVRFLISDKSAVRQTIKAMAIICAIQGVTMINEQVTHVNVFGVLNGYFGVTVRDGQIRSGAVLGCLYAGVFAGILTPLFIWLRKEGKSPVLGLLGILGAIAMVITSRASTSIMACGGSICGLAFWPVRRQMRMLRWALVIILVSLHLVMNGPVWSLIAHVDLTGSSSSYHRYYLVDNLIRHFSDWWLLGYRYYNDWGWDMWDTCDQFVAVGLTGGLLTLALYIMILKRGFAFIGNARKLVSGDREHEWLLWCLGAALFSTVVASFGINFMAQLQMLLFPIWACISVIAGNDETAITMGRVAGPEFAEELWNTPEPISVLDEEPGYSNLMCNRIIT